MRRVVGIVALLLPLRLPLLVVLLAALLAPRMARADPHPLPFTYPYSTLPRGMSEIEQYVDMTPVRAIDSSGQLVTTSRGILITEIEYGLTDRLELGIYLQFSNDDPAIANPGGPSALRFDGLKQRLRYRFAEAGVWPVDLGIYGEVAELSNEIELEAKIIVERRFGRWLANVNLWGEREFYYSGRREWVANPTGGVSFEVVPAFRVGLEYWMRAEFGAPAPRPIDQFNQQAHHFVGPAFLLQGKRVWLAVAPYLRLDSWGRDGERFGGERFGRFWIRTIIGLEL